MRELEEKAYFPSELVIRLKLSFSSVSKNLKKLEERGLITCETPNVKKGKFYSITDGGREILYLLDKHNNS